MSGEFRVEPGVLNDIAGTLRTAARDLDSLGGSAPSSLDAGDVGGPLADIIAHLLDNAGQFSTAIADAGDKVTHAAGDYANQDATARDALSESGEG